MERSWDTIRELLLRVDVCPKDNIVMSADFPAERGSEFLQHVELLLEAKLIDADVIRSLAPSESQFHIFRLTWGGYELLETIRNDDVWRQTQQFFVHQKLGMTLDSVLSVARQLNSAMM